MQPLNEQKKPLQPIVSFRLCSAMPLLVEAFLSNNIALNMVCCSVRINHTPGRNLFVFKKMLQKFIFRNPLQLEAL
jgi:hypothetical protein